jgi:hypothetical protein
LHQALAETRRGTTPLRIWWRDDDATRVTSAFDRLEKLSRSLDMPVHIAAIPHLAEPGLAHAVRSVPHLIPVVHGWSHRNHAEADAKKSEFGQPRPEAEEEVRMALAHMRQLFGPAVVPLFVPPWNRIDPSVTGTLTAAGYRGLSTFAPRPSAEAAPGLLQINTHIDPIDWRGTRNLVDPAIVIERTTEILRNRSEGIFDAGEPLGYLTHHLVHTPELWDFSGQFLNELLQGGAVIQPISLLVEAA